MKLVSIAAVVLFPRASLAAGPNPATIAACIPKLERNLKQNTLACWYPLSLDKVNGGYMVDFNSAALDPTRLSDGRPNFDRIRGLNSRIRHSSGTSRDHCDAIGWVSAQ